MAYRVTAPLVLAHDNLGKVRYHYQGAVIPWLNDEQAEHFQNLDLVEKVGSDEPPAVSEAAFGVKPKKTGTQAAWVDFAVSHGADRAEARALSREELVELYGDK